MLIAPPGRACAHSSRQMSDNWDLEQQSEEWRPFAKAGKSYGAQRPGDDNPWREGRRVLLTWQRARYTLCVLCRAETPCARTRLCIAVG